MESTPTSRSSIEPGTAWTFSHHLRRRAFERGVTDAEIRAALNRPDITYDQSTHGPDRQVRQCDRVGVVVDVRSRTVITVVFRDADSWRVHRSRVAA